MLSRRHPSSLLLLALLGASAVAVAGPQDARDRSAQQGPEIHDSRERADSMPPPFMSREQTRPQRPLRVIDREERRERQRRQENALSDSVRRIERRTRGQVLSAERVPYEGRDLNRIKVIDENGRVRVFMDDPAQPPTRGDDD